MADRIITVKVTDIVSGEALTFSYDADTKVLSANVNSAIHVEVVSDA